MSTVMKNSNEEQVHLSGDITEETENDNTSQNSFPDNLSSIEKTSDVSKHEERDQQPSFSAREDFIFCDWLSDSQSEVLSSSVDKLDDHVYSIPQRELDEEEIEWSEYELEEDEEDMLEDSDPEDLSLEESKDRHETKTVPKPAEKSKSLSYHFQFLADSTKEAQLDYLQCLRQMPLHYDAFKEAKEESTAKLTSYSKKQITLPNKGKRTKHYLQVEAPVLHTLLNVLNFIPDMDTKNKVVAWLMYPGHSKQLAHLFKTVLSSTRLWKHVIKTSRQKFLKNLIVPRSSNQDELAFPIVPLKKTKLNRSFIVHQTCPFYHNKNLCRYKITGLKKSVRDILQKYDIPVKTSLCGSRKGNFPEEFTSRSNVKPSDKRKSR
jgi:hypothetical protein